MRVLYVGPNIKGRYFGGIANIFKKFSEVPTGNFVNSISATFTLFNSHKLKHTPNSEGKWKFENIVQAIFLLCRLFIKVVFNKYEIIHFNTSAKLPLIKDLLILYLLGPFISKNRIIVHIHMCGSNEVFVKNKPLRSIQFYLLKRYKLIVLSNSFKFELINHGFNASNIFYLPNFHNNLFLDSKTVYYNISQVNLIFIGSISERKGFVDLLKSLVNIDIPYELNVLGDFESESIYCLSTDIILTNNLKVNFLGYKSGAEKDSIIKSSQILILPSYAEGFPMVIPEAFSFGLVVISTNISSIPEIISNGYNGFIVKPGDYDSIQLCIKELYNDPKLFEFVSSNSFLSSKDYTFEKHLNLLDVIYKNIYNEN